MGLQAGLEDEGLRKLEGLLYIYALRLGRRISAEPRTIYPAPRKGLSKTSLTTHKTFHSITTGLADIADFHPLLCVSSVMVMTEGPYNG